MPPCLPRPQDYRNARRRARQGTEDRKTSTPRASRRRRASSSREGCRLGLERLRDSRCRRRALGWALLGFHRSRGRDRDRRVMEGGEGISKDTSRFLCQKRKRQLRRDLGMRDIKPEEHWEETKSLASGHCRRFRGSFTVSWLCLLVCTKALEVTPSQHG